MSDYGSRIKETRKLRGLTQQEVADAAGMSVMTIRRYESGERTPNIASLRKIAEAMGCSVTDIIPLEPSVVSAIVSELTDEEYSSLMSQYVQSWGTKPVLSAQDIFQMFIDEVKDAEDMRNKIVNCFNSLNIKGKKRLFEYAVELTKIKDYDIDDDLYNND